MKQALGCRPVSSWNKSARVLKGRGLQPRRQYARNHAALAAEETPHRLSTYVTNLRDTTLVAIRAIALQAESDLLDGYKNQSPAVACLFCLSCALGGNCGGRVAEGIPMIFGNVSRIMLRMRSSASSSSRARCSGCRYIRQARSCRALHTSSLA